MTVHGLSQPPPVRRRSCGDRAIGPRSTQPIDANLEAGRDPAAGVSRRRAGPAASPTSRAAASRCSATCSARWSGCGTSVPRFARAAGAAGGAAGRSGRPAAAAAAVSEGALGGLADARPRKVATGPVLAHETTHRPTAAVEVVARRRRGVHHAAAGLHRGPRPARASPTSNLGMYRVQLSGGQYEPNREVGLHYQIHRGIAAHHAAAHAAQASRCG